MSCRFFPWAKPALFLGLITSDRDAADIDLPSRRRAIGEFTLP
jgi:hypothetical protein